MKKKNNKSLTIQHWQTNNGVQVLFVQREEIPIVEVSVIFKAGSYFDGDKYGLSQLTNSMLDKGTQSYTIEEILEGFDEIGAQFNSTSDRDMAVISFRSLAKPKYLSAALKIYKEIVTKPTFPEESFLWKQHLTREAIHRQEKMPEMIARNAFYKVTYGKHPYSHSVLGTIDSITQLTCDDLTQFYNQYYVSRNAILTIVGDLTRKQAERLANDITQDLKDVAPSQISTQAAVILPAVSESINFPAEQTHIIIGQVGINYHHQYFPLMIGNQILGGSSFTSRLFSQIRGHHGLAYSIMSNTIPLAANGPFIILMQTRKQQAQKALKLTLEILENFINKGPTKKELISVQKRITNRFTLNLAGNDDIANHLLRIGFYNLPFNYLDHYCAQINSVTLGHIKDAFQERFSSTQMIKIIVGHSG